MARNIVLNATRQTGAPAIELRLLGPMELFVDGVRADLPQSKKTRALLAYLGVSDRPVLRTRLCSLLWDETDDPRGALRWSLSRLRKSMRGADCIVADNQQVALDTATINIDVCNILDLGKMPLEDVETKRLEAAAGLYRGEFLESLDLAELLDFDSWCIGRREDCRRAICDLLTELVQRLDPASALPYARQLVDVDAVNLQAYQKLLDLLLRLGRQGEARKMADHAQRLFRQVSAKDAMALEMAWRKLKSEAAEEQPQPTRPEPVVPTSPSDADSGVEPEHFVGRKKELEKLTHLFDSARQSNRPALALITGEPGLGKSRLAERFSDIAASAGFSVFRGRAFEAESSRPFSPWADALDINIEQTVNSASLLSREELFVTISERLSRASTASSGVFLVLDDLQWFDQNSTEFLHFLTRTYRQSPFFALLLAREGELDDNDNAVRLLRSLRGETELHRMTLEPLPKEDLADLVEGLSEMDAKELFAVSNGNPLYALEYVRAGVDEGQGLPPTLLQLVRERTAQLPDAAADVLRWGAVLGHSFDPDILEAVTSLSPDELLSSLERLERHSLLHIDAKRSQGRYVFSHQLVRDAIYNELSSPRRRLMHRRIAQLLTQPGNTFALTADLVHHAHLAGEALIAVRACVEAGSSALRVFANADASALARRGLRLAEELDEAERIEATLDLLHVLYSARTPERKAAISKVRELANQALDLGLTHAARMGFQMLSFLRWEGSSLKDAHENILQAERVSRAGAAGDRTDALAYAARCLVLLERSLPQAEAFAIEAETVAKSENRQSAAVCFAKGMIAAHRGEADQALAAFEEARLLGRQSGEHLVEFGALEHQVMFELDTGDDPSAARHAVELVTLGDKVRKGAEASVARALSALAGFRQGETDAIALREAVEAVREADSKFELAYLLTRWAIVEMRRGNIDTTRELALDALGIAKAMGRNSELAIAKSVLAAVSGEGEAEACQEAASGETDLAGSSVMSWFARRWMDQDERASSSAEVPET